MHVFYSVWFIEVLAAILHALIYQNHCFDVNDDNVPSLGRVAVAYLGSGCRGCQPPVTFKPSNELR